MGKGWSDECKLIRDKGQEKIKNYLYPVRHFLWGRGVVARSDFIRVRYVKTICCFHVSLFLRFLMLCCYLVNFTLL